MKPKSIPGGSQAAGQPQTFPGAGSTLAGFQSTTKRNGLRKILVPVDFSDCSIHALDYGLMLATEFEATLILLHVVEPASFSGHYLPARLESEEDGQGPLSVERERVTELQRKRVGHRVRAEALVRIGRPWSEIPDTAKALAADLIVLGAHGNGPRIKSHLGSTAEGVLRHADCPVLTVS